MRVWNESQDKRAKRVTSMAGLGGDRQGLTMIIIYKIYLLLVNILLVSAITTIVTIKCRVMEVTLQHTQSPHLSSGPGKGSRCGSHA